MPCSPREVHPLHGIVSQKMVLFVVTPVRTSNLTYVLKVSLLFLIVYQKTYQFLILLFVIDEKYYVKVRISAAVS
jgi:hypothetical protein